VFNFSAGIISQCYFW